MSRITESSHVAHSFVVISASSLIKSKKGKPFEFQMHQTHHPPSSSSALYLANKQRPSVENNRLKASANLISCTASCTQRALDVSMLCDVASQTLSTRNTHTPWDQD